MRSTRYNFVLSMKKWELVRLMLAVALLFGIHGPVFILADSILAPGSIALLVIRTLLVGSFSAFIVLAIRYPWIGVPLVAVGMIAMVSSEQITSYITGRDEHIVESIPRTVQLTPEDLDSIRQRRLVIYGASALLVGASWAMMATVLNSEGKKRGRLEAEIKIAKEIQHSLLPAPTFSNGWCSVSGLAIPTSEVNGDYYDVIELSKEALAVIIADVSGHGVGAGIVSAMTKSAVHSQLIHDPSPAEVLSNLNMALSSLTQDNTFVTCAYVFLDKKSGSVSFATAGHPPILHRAKNASTINEFRTPNLALGIKKGVIFKEHEKRYSSGDLFLLHTDGITEATEKSGEQFGLDRLKYCLANEVGSDNLCERIVREVKKFTKSDEFADDVTLVTITIDS